VHRTSGVPRGRKQPPPQACQGILTMIWSSRENRGYARCVLGDGSSLGTTGMRDWITRGVHVGGNGQQFLRSNHPPALEAANAARPADLDPARKASA
jgi:hypothetical protein